jgi:hypothetical protein
MEDEIPGESSPFFRAMMTGLFVGFAACIVCLLYNLIYRDAGNYFPSLIISVSSLIFGVNLLFLIIGVIFAAFVNARRKGETIYTILFLVLTVLAVIAALHSHRTTGDAYMNGRFRGLLTGVVVILGLSAAVAVPICYHSKGFHKHFV